ncbi:MAG: hypothetical protein RDV48_09225 [Candidatus Eremiobacteraeota bacterium]|nr:hypothetical protein [Candidatus Eremiobacteraeota bacterium]
METHIGLTPEEMIYMFNRMYLDVWEKSKEKINWDEDGRVSQKTLMEVLEVVITAARDGAIITMYENNEKIHHDLQQMGLVAGAPAAEQGF